MIYQYFWRARLAKKMGQNEEIKNMSELKSRITENGIDYILVGDYYIPNLKLPEEHRPIGKYGRMHREYLREVHPVRLNTLILTGELWTYLADLNEQAQDWRIYEKQNKRIAGTARADARVIRRTG